MDNFADIKPQQQFLFISQWTIGEELSKFAVEIDQHPAFDWEIVYKLHPGEYDRWEQDPPVAD